MRRPLRLLPFILAFAWLTASAESPTLEYQVKASYLYNFAQFVEWPEEVLKSSDALVIGVLGEDRMGKALYDIADKSIGSHKVAVTRCKSLDEIKGCHLLFISNSEDAKRTAILEALKPWPILSIGEADGFARDGGVINFVKVQTKIRFEINQAAAARRGIKISSKLLKLATTVFQDEAPANPRP